MIIEVYRDDGLLTGAPIVEPLLSDTALLSRGRAEMDAHAHAVDRLDLTTLYRPGVQPGQLARIEHDGQLLTGKIVGVEIQSDGERLTLNLSLEIPR